MYIPFVLVYIYLCTYICTYCLKERNSYCCIISDTTTTSTTTTTLRYRTFIEDGSNIAWLVACGVVGLACLIAASYVIYTCKMKQLSQLW